jgi:hypothetical protein
VDMDFALFPSKLYQCVQQKVYPQEAMFAMSIT